MPRMARAPGIPDSLCLLSAMLRDLGSHMVALRGTSALGVPIDTTAGRTTAS